MIKDNIVKYVSVSALILAALLLRKKKPNSENIIDKERAQSVQAPTYSAAQYASWANVLERAMFDLGTDEAAIYRVFEFLRNDRDFLELYTAFGRRNYTGGFIPFFQGKLDLAQWINEELTSSEISRLNSILQSHNIKYRF